ncbi:MAG: hypothetical protein ABI459_10455, partial [Deltaproteobacteria bacterium]
MTAAGVLDRLAGERALAASANAGTHIERTILEFGLMDEEVLYRHLAEFHDLLFIGPDDIDPSLIPQIGLPLDFMQRLEFVAASDESGVLTLAFSDPRSSSVAASIAYDLKREVSMALASPTTIRAALGTASSSAAPIESVSDSDIERLRALANDGPIIKLVNDLIAEVAP